MTFFGKFATFIFIANSMTNIEILNGIVAGANNAYVNLTPDELVQKALERKEGVITSRGSLAADTGEFTGRSPKDKFTVCDEKTEDTVWWGNVNFKFEPSKFDALLEKVLNHYKGKDLFVRDSYACANPDFRLN